jgi:hypothetical protein
MRAATDICLNTGLTPSFLATASRQVDLVADQFARFRVDEAVRLVGAEHAEDDLALLLDVGQLVGMGRQRGQREGGCRGERQETGQPHVHSAILSLSSLKSRV